MTPEPGPENARGRTRLGAFDIACVVIGGIIGIGIFFTPAQVARSVDAPWQVTAAWSLGGAIAILGALVFARLSRLATGPGGVFEYIRQSFGSRLAFLYGWCNLMIIQSGALAFVALLLVSNLEKAIAYTFTPFWQHAIATSVLLGLTMINIAGLQLGKGVQNTLTAIKTTAVFAIVVVAILVDPALPAVAETAPARESVGFLVAMSAAMLPVLFSFGGWQHGSFVAMVARNPHRDVPLGIVGGVLVVVLAYICVNLAYLDLLGFDQASESSTIAVDAMQVAFVSGDAGSSKIPQLFAALIVLSAAGLMNTICMAPPYVLQTMAKRGLFFAAVGRLHPRFGTPALGMLVQGLWAAALMWGVYLSFENSIDSLDFLLNGVVFVDWMGFGVCGIGLLVLLRRQARAQGQALELGSCILGALFALSALAVTVGALVTKTMPSLVGLGVLLVGIPAYWAFTRRAG